MKYLISKINYLGDAVSFLPTLRGLAEHFPEAQITVMCTPVGREIFAGSVENLDFFIVDYREVRSRKAFLRLGQAIPALRKRKIDFSMHSYDEPSFSYLASALAGIRRRIGFASGVAKAQRLLTESIPFDTSRNVVDINYDLVRHMTGRKELQPSRVPIWYSDQDDRIIVERLSQVGLKYGEPFIAIHPGAKFNYKEWGVNNFVNLSNRIEKTFNIPVIFITEQNYANLPRIKSVTGLNIKQLACLLEKGTIFIGNNSGPMNVAAAMGTPCVVIQGPSSSNWEIFWKDRDHRILKATNLNCVPCERLGRLSPFCRNEELPNGCMKMITPEMVEKAIIELLDDEKLWKIRNEKS